MKLLVLAMLILASCSTTFKRQAKTQARISEAAREEAQATSMAIDRVRQDMSAARALAPSQYNANATAPLRNPLDLESWGLWSPSQCNIGIGRTSDYSITECSHWDHRISVNDIKGWILCSR